MMEDSGENWYVLRVTYSRELKVQKVLQDKGMRVFVPMKTVREEKGGRVVKKSVPAVNNLLFVYSDQQTIYDHILSEGDAAVTRFIWDRVSRKPLIVPKRQMEDFIRVCEASADDAVFISEMDEKLRSGVRVRVCFGPLAGVEGTVIRIKKSRRILVELPELFSVASTYIPLEYLEVIK
ncbi:MAG: UpxY family transcription antiterminator [Bacteroidales bacterium]|nr:UpxY family transcription antiterminator [Bacteroidales bacterium]